MFGCGSKSNNPIKKPSKQVESKHKLDFTAIGYIDSFPVFNDYEKKELLISKETGKLEFLMNYPKSYFPVFICNDGIIYRKNDSIIIHYQNGLSKSLFLKEGIFFISGFNDLSKFVVVNKLSEIVLIDLNANKITNSHIIATDFIYLISDVLLFGVYHENDDAMKVYKTKLDELEENKIVLVTENISGDPWILTPNGKYIVCDDPDYKLAIYNIATKSFQNVDLGIPLEEITYSLTCSYYSYQEKAIVFYNPHTFEVKIIKPE